MTTVLAYPCNKNNIYERSDLYFWRSDINLQSSEPNTFMILSFVYSLAAKNRVDRVKKTALIGTMPPEK